MAEPLTLLLHTSTPTARIGLADGDKIVARDEFAASRELASTLADRIHRLFEAQKSKLEAVRKIFVHAGPAFAIPLRPAFAIRLGAAVSLGEAEPRRKPRRKASAGRQGFAGREATAGRPGGFTSLRIGVTTANALAYALGIPVVGIRGEVGSLEALLESSRGMEPTAQGMVVTEYSAPPNIGPVPGR